MIKDFVVGYVLGAGTILALGFWQLEKKRRSRVSALRSVFFDNPVPEVEDYDMYVAPHGMGIRVGLEDGDIIYGWAEGDKVTEITAIEWGEKGGIQALSQLAEELAEDDEDEYVD